MSSRVTHSPFAAPQEPVVLEHLDDPLVHRAFRPVGIRANV
jgi:hypothetical protein